MPKKGQNRKEFFMPIVNILQIAQDGNARVGFMAAAGKVFFGRSVQVVVAIVFTLATQSIFAFMMRTKNLKLIAMERVL